MGDSAIGRVVSVRSSIQVIKRTADVYGRWYDPRVCRPMENLDVLVRSKCDYAVAYWTGIDWVTHDKVLSEIHHWCYFQHVSEYDDKH